MCIRDRINIANALKNNGSVSAEDRDALTEAVNEAVEVLNRLPKMCIRDSSILLRTWKEI